MNRKHAIILAVLMVAATAAAVLAEEPRALSGKVVVMVIAPDNFRDEELFEPQRVLSDKGAEVKVASTVKGKPVKGMLGGKVTPELTLDEIDVSKLDALIFVGGAKVYFDSQKLHTLAGEVFQQRKVLGAICIAPAILARAGVLRGKKATVYSGVKNELIAMGADYTGQAVQTDGKIVTASGPAAATEFANEVGRLLLSK